MSNSEQQTNNYRSAVLNDHTFNTLPSYANEVLRTPFAGNVHSLAPPPLPQLPNNQQIMPSYGSNYNNYYGGGGMNMFGGYGGFAGGYNGGYNGGYGYNRFGSGMDGSGMNPLDPEYRFIQLAEASSRPAFQSIESLVAAVGNIAAMLDSTFFALTSSFRAVLGVAANFGRLRGVFAQFWHTFALFRGLSYLYKKIVYWLHLSNIDPAKKNFNKIVADALNVSNGAPPLPAKGQSPWPILAFLSFIFTAPYLIMKLLGTVARTAQTEARNPLKWIRPIETVALYDFQARNDSEISLTNGQRVIVAPKEIQNSQMLLNTGWALASVDGRTSGLIPLNYVKSPQQLREDSQMPILQKQQQQQQPTSTTYAESIEIPVQHIEQTKPSELKPAPQTDIDFNSLKVTAFPPPPASTMLRPSQKNKLNNATTIETKNIEDDIK